MKRFLLLMSLLALTACSGTNGSPAGTPPGAEDSSFVANNSAILSGGAIGSGTEALASLRKTVPVTLTTPREGLELSADAYVTRGSATSETPYWLFTIRNTAEETVCFVRLNTVNVLDASGAVIETDEFDFIYGSVKQTPSSATWTDTCLEPGQSAYSIGISTDISYSDISRFSVAGFEEPLAGVSEPAGQLKPRNYTVSASSGLSMFSLAVENVGSAAALFDIGLYIPLAADSTPLHWGFVLGEPEGTLINANSTEIFEESVMYTGAAERLYITLNFERPEETTATQLRGLSLTDALEQRDLSEQAKLEALRSR